MNRVQKGHKHGQQHDDEDDNQWNAFVREHGGYSCSHYVGTRRVDALLAVFDERMFIPGCLICATTGLAAIFDLRREHAPQSVELPPLLTPMVDCRISVFLQRFSVDFFFAFLSATVSNGASWQPGNGVR
jgi:hypothetical protein